MSALILPSRFRQQPQYPAHIDWSNPITRGLIFAHNPAIGEINLVTSQSPLNTTGFAKNVGPTGKRINLSGSSNAEFSDNGASVAGNSLTIVSIWRAKDSQYAFADGTGILVSSRTAGNAGFSWGRTAAQSGGATGNLTSQTFVVHGVAQYTEANATIESLVDSPVAFRASGTVASWFRFGKKSSADTTIGTCSTGSALVIGGLGPYGSSGWFWTDRAYLTLVFNRPLGDDEIALLTSSVASPWQIFKKPARRIWIPAAGGAGAQTLTPSLFTNSQSFYAPSVTTGAVTLTAGLFTNSNSFFGHTLTTNYGLVATLFTNSQTFYAPTVTPGAVTLTPGLFSNSQTFYAPIVTQDGGPQYVTPDLYSSSQTFYTHVVSQSGGTQDITPALYSNSQSFYAPAVTVGGVSLLPALFENSQTFYAPTVGSGGFSGELSDEDIDRIVVALLLALNATTIPVNVKQFNDNPISGTGRSGDPVTAI